MDDAQDITILYYELICKINKDNNAHAKICLMGDSYQSIYGFSNADECYISYGDQLFNFNDSSWKNVVYQLVSELQTKLPISLIVVC